MFFFQIQTTADEVLTSKKAAEQCVKNKKSAVCLAKLVIKIDEDITKLPIEIAKDAKDVENAVAYLKPNVVKCGTESIYYCTYEGQTLLNQINKCVLNKIIHK